MEKKIYLSLALVIFLFSTTLSQIEKNDLLLGGNLGFNASNSANGNASFANGNSTSNANIAPHIAYALGKNSTLGLNLGYSYTDNPGNYKLSSFISNIFYKKYFPCKEKFGIFLQLYAGIVLAKSSYLVLDSTGLYTKNNSTTHDYEGGIVPGVYYQVSKRVLLTAECGGLSYAYYDFGEGNSSSSLSLDFLTNFTF